MAGTTDTKSDSAVAFGEATAGTVCCCDAVRPSPQECDNVVAGQQITAASSQCDTAAAELAARGAALADAEASAASAAGAANALYAELSAARRDLSAARAQLAALERDAAEAVGLLEGVLGSTGGAVGTLAPVGGAVQASSLENSGGALGAAASAAHGLAERRTPAALEAGDADTGPWQPPDDAGSTAVGAWQPPGGAGATQLQLNGGHPTGADGDERAVASATTSNAPDRSVAAAAVAAAALPASASAVAAAHRALQAAAQVRLDGCGAVLHRRRCTDGVAQALMYTWHCTRADV
eukprot:50083-Chlamydomonas_euryale.AAC.1